MVVTVVVLVRVDEWSKEAWTLSNKGWDLSTPRFRNLETKTALCLFFFFFFFFGLKSFFFFLVFGKFSLSRTKKSPSRKGFLQK